MKQHKIAIKNNKITIPKHVMLKKSVKKESIAELKWGGTKTNTFWLWDTRSNRELINRLFNHNFDVPSVQENNIILKSEYFKTQPFSHQIESLKKCNSREYFAYFLQQGLGKTKVLIDDVTILNKEKNLDIVLVVCPKSVLSVWEKEIDIHSPLKNNVAIWPNYVIAKNVDVNWFIINPDILIGKGGEFANQFLLSSTKTMIAIDESTIIKNPKSKRTKILMGLKNLSSYRRILTGTPLANSPVDLFAQMKFLSDEAVDFRNFYSFKKHYCIFGGWKNKEIIGYRNQNQLSKIINKNGIRIKTEDATDLPEKTYQKRYIELGKESKALYKRIKDEILVEIEEEKITTEQAITKTLKLSQITGGSLKTDDGGLLIIGSEKIKETLHIINESGRLPALIWCQFTADITRLEESLSSNGYKVSTLTGSSKADNRKRIVDNVENGDTDILIIQNQAGAMGITLNKATLSIFFSNNWSPMVREQSEFRNWRIGQKNNVLYIDLLCKNLIDEYIYNALMRKQDLNESIISRNNVIQLLKTT